MFHNYLQDNLVFFLTWLTSILLVRAILARYRTKPHLPPSPRALPIIGHMHLLAPIPHQALHKLSGRYGPLFHIFIGSNPCVIVSSPEIARQVLKTHEGSFLNRPKMANPDYLTYGSADFTFAPYGPYWKFIKKLCMTQLLGGPTLDHLRPIREEELNMFLKLIHRKAEKGNENFIRRQLSSIFDETTGVSEVTQLADGWRSVQRKFEFDLILINESEPTSNSPVRQAEPP